MKTAAYAFVVTFLVVGFTLPPYSAHADNGAVPKVFYIAADRALVPRPPSPGAPAFSNITQTPLEFVIRGPIFATPTVTVAGPAIFSLWILSNRTADLQLRAAFLQRYGTTISDNRTSVDTKRLNATVFPQPYNFTYNIQGNQPLLYGAQVSFQVRLTSLAPRTNVTLFWASSSAPSMIVLPLSGYISLATRQGPIVIKDINQNPASSFDLNATNIVIIEAFVDSTFGHEDIGRVNMTIIDPTLKPVLGRTNITLEEFPLNPLPPFVYRPPPWLYPSTATPGIYQVYIDIFDQQGNRAFSFRSSTTFTLFRSSIFSRPPLSLIPYFAVGGVVLAASVVAYGKRRKRKSYLVPFDHFNTLTGGELDGGTVVTVEGNTGSGKSLLSEQLMYEDLKKGRPCVFVATGDFPSNIRENMSSMGLDASGYEQSGLLTFVDGYSSEAGQESREKFSIPFLGDLTTMNMKITSSLPIGSFKGGSLYFDSLTPLASKTKPESLISFVQSVGAKVRGLGGKAFFTIGPSVDGNVQKRLEDLADCVVQMEAFEESGARRSRLRIAKLRTRRFQQGWVIYTIEDGRGIIFYSKKPRQ